MRCGSCGAALLAGAMFCGECGRKVATVTSPLPLVELPVSVPLVFVEPVTEVADDTVDSVPFVELDEEVERTILAPRRRPPWTLTGVDGIPHPIRVATVVGRAPQRPANRRELDLLPLVDATKSLSKTHAVLEPHGDVLTIEDLGSTNGIVILNADGSETDLPPGRPVALAAGTVLGLGDCVLTVGRADTRPAS